MIKIEQYLQPDRIVAMRTIDHDEIVNQLVAICLRDMDPDSRARLRKKALRAMSMKDQGLGKGFAITHARIDEMDEIRVAAGFLPQPVRFARWPDVHTVFCAIIPSGKASAYLGFMARLCRMLMQPGPRSAFATGDREQVLRKVRAFDA